MTQYKIYIGSAESPYYEFDNSTIRSLRGTNSVDIVGSELSIDEFRFEVECDLSAVEFFAPADYDIIETSDGYLFATAYQNSDVDLRELPVGTVIFIYQDDILIGKFYSSSVERTGKTSFYIRATSGIGMLQNSTHYGGIYTGQTFLEIATDIIGEDVTFSCEDDVATLPIFGWLPVDTRRNNLHQLLFASGVSLTKDINGDILFSYLYETDAEEIEDARIYLRGSVDYKTPSNTVEVTEHTYEALDSDDELILFDNASGPSYDNAIVKFDFAPIHDLRSEGLEIKESGVNYAIVSGTGRLYGKPYTHIQQVITRDVKYKGKKHTKTVTDATLVSVANSENVAKRVLSYYSSKKTIKGNIVLNGEKCGHSYSLHDVFGDLNKAFLTRIDMTASGIVKAECEFISDYMPTGQGNNYSHAYVFYGQDIFFWDVPEVILEKENPTIKVILIGGGQGGQSGGKGGDYTGDAKETGSEDIPFGYRIGDIISGEGGEGGAGGKGGKIYSTIIDCTNIRYFNFTFGKGGAGGYGELVNGSNGTDTSLYAFPKNSDVAQQYSSADGRSSSSGYLNIFNGIIYALNGDDGVKGGRGSTSEEIGDTVTFKGENFYPSGDGAISRNNSYGYAEHGYGGGAAAGSSSASAEERGGDANIPTSTEVRSGSGGKGRTGGNGANAISFGSGGSGGHGGGGAGMSGQLIVNDVGPGYWVPWAYGGNGGNGGRGGDGCIIMFY